MYKTFAQIIYSLQGPKLITSTPSHPKQDPEASFANNLALAFSISSTLVETTPLVPVGRGLWGGMSIRYMATGTRSPPSSPGCATTLDQRGPRGASTWRMREDL